jgi:hypothetical protein
MSRRSRPCWTGCCHDRYYCRFIKNYGAIATPLTALLKKYVFKWTAEAKVAFRVLQRTLTMALILQLPDFSRDFVVECDVSDTGLLQPAIKAMDRWLSSAAN